LRERKKLIAIVKRGSEENAFMSLRMRYERVGVILLSVERGEDRGNWFKGFGVAPHRRATT
jgi:hypothetical protein